MTATETTDLVIPGREFDAAEHADDMAGILRVARLYGIRVRTRITGPLCLSVSKGDLSCSRREDHGGRCHATFLGLVLAVWHQEDW